MRADVRVGWRGRAEHESRVPPQELTETISGITESSDHATRIPSMRWMDGCRTRRRDAQHSFESNVAKAARLSSQGYPACPPARSSRFRGFDRSRGDTDLLP